jgi:hydrophobe/amphiphile efflux-3 (HAE3) family protein
MLTVLIGSQATNLYMQSDFSKYLPEDDPTLELWDRITEEFQLGSTIIILINQEGRGFNNIRDYEVLIEMDEIYRVIYEDLITDGKETGIISIQSIAKLIREENAKPPFVETGGGNNCDCIPQDSNDISEYMGRLTLSSTKGILYTSNYRTAVIIMQLDDNADYNEVLERTRAAIEDRGTKHANMTITGTIAMQQAVQKQSMNNIVIIFPISIILVSIVLFFFHRSFKGIVIAFLPPAFALALTFGTLGIVSPELTIISVAIVSLLMGLGVDYSIHLMNRFAEEKNISNSVDRIEKIFKSTAKAVLLSTVTTIIGFASLMISNMNPMVRFGFGCAIGIFYCFISAMILVPCFCLILKFEKTGRIPRWDKFARFAVSNRKRIILIAVFFAIMSVVLLPQVQTDVNYFDLAPEEIPELDALLEYGDKFGGGANFNAIMVETDPSGLEDPKVIEGLFEMEKQIRTKGVTVSSIFDPLKEYKDQMEGSIILKLIANLTDANKIIFDRIAEEGLVNSDHSKTLILVSFPLNSSMQKIEKTVNEINQITDSWELPRNGRVSRLTGQDAKNVAVNNKLFDEQSRSMIIALILVLAALIVIFNSSMYGFLTLIPVCFVLMWEPGFLVGTSIALSPVTITIAAIMIGIGIDYGIHITHRFREELSRGLSKIEATKIAIEKTGLSLVEAAMTTVFGMASIYFIGISALSEFVTIIIFMTSMSCIAAALLLPMFYDNRFVK